MLLFLDFCLFFRQMVPIAGQTMQPSYGVDNGANSGYSFDQQNGGIVGAATPAGSNAYGMGVGGG